MSNNINIRAITFSVDIMKIHEVSYQNQIAKNIINISENLNKNYLVRTLRINIVKIQANQITDETFFLEKIILLSKFCKSINIRWFNLCFDLTNSNKKQSISLNNLTVKIIKKFDNVFVNWIVANQNYVNQISAYYASKCILSISKLSSNGYDNFRFGVNLNPNSGTPFFPFSYSKNDFSFSLALELTEFVDSIVLNNINYDLDFIEKECVKALNDKLSSLDGNLSKINLDTISFEGYDCSLAPYPDSKVSVTKIYKYLKIDEFGSYGSVYLTGFLTSIIKNLNSKFKFCGFNGVMFSLLEDHDMCKSNNKKIISIDQILLNSCVCGCGLDMIPIPGDSLIEEVASIILDTATLSIKLNKPLGVRLLPIPNKHENDFTEFDMDFITNTRILPLKNLAIDYEFF